MNDMFSRSWPPPGSSGPGGVVARLLGLLLWVVLALLGLAFALGLLLWLAAMTVISLVAALFTGRPAAVTLLWRRYREMTRQHWPQRPAASATPRADAAGATGASQPAGVQDVTWREVPAQPADASDGAGDARR